MVSLDYISSVQAAASSKNQELPGGVILSYYVERTSAQSVEVLEIRYMSFTVPIYKITFSVFLACIQTEMLEVFVTWLI